MRYTWRNLDIARITRGLLRLKYPQCPAVETHLLPTNPLGKGLRELCSHAHTQHGCDDTTLQCTIKHATVDGVKLETLLGVISRGCLGPPQRRPTTKQRVSKADIHGICRLVMQKLGPSHTEQVYELALSQELYDRGIPHVRQMPVTTRYGRSVNIPAGIIDIEVDHRFLIELKSGPFNERHVQQLMRYMSAMRSNGRAMECAMVVCFQCDGKVVFKNV